MLNGRKTSMGEDTKRGDEEEGRIGRRKVSRWKQRVEIECEGKKRKMRERERERERERDIHMDR